MNATERLLKAIEQLHDSEHRLRGLPARLQQRRLGNLASRVFDEIVGEIEHDILIERRFRVGNLKQVAPTLLVAGAEASEA